MKYCQDCKNYHHHIYDVPIGDSCKSPKNIYREIKINTYLRQAICSIKLEPHEKNKDNDCDWYVRKEKI